MRLASLSYCGCEGTLYKAGCGRGALSAKGEVVVLIIKASRYCVVSVFLDVDFLLN